RSLTELRLRGLELTLQRDDQGAWQVRGLPGGQQTAGDPLDVLQGLGELQVVDARLTIDAPGLGLSQTLPKLDLRMQVDRGRVRAAARAWMTPEAAPLDLRLDLQRRNGDGRVYAAMPAGDLRVWSALLGPARIRVDAGSGRLSAWIDVRA